ncbi:MAG: FHA domain-containing protein, partial [bacterium]
MCGKRHIPAMTYLAPPAAPSEADPGWWSLVAYPGAPEERRFSFDDRIEIGRSSEKRGEAEGVLLVSDPTVSARHCVITRAADGRYFIRDMSRNGTRLDGRRLVPNVEVEIRPGQLISVGGGVEFRLEGESAGSEDTGEEWGATTPYVEPVVITVLVGDIRDYTRLIQKADLAAVQHAVRRVFHKLEDEVVRLGGTVKEIRGDALFGFWEEGLSENPASDACRAALSI